MTVDRKLRLRLELIAALPEPIMLDRLRRLSKAELIAFRRLFGIRECCCKGRCAIHQHGELHAARICVAEERSRRLAARLLRELRNDPTSMYQSRCECAACRQAMPSIPFIAHQLLAQRLVPEGETAPRPPRMRPNRKRIRLKAKPTTKFVPEPFRFGILFPPDADDFAALIEPHAEQHLVLDPNKVLAAVFERSSEMRPAEELNRVALRRVGVQLGDVLRREPWGRGHAPKKSERSYARAHQSHADALGPLLHGGFSAVDSSPAVDTTAA